MLNDIIESSIRKHTKLCKTLTGSLSEAQRNYTSFYRPVKLRYGKTTYQSVHRPHSWCFGEIRTGSVIQMCRDYIPNRLGRIWNAKNEIKPLKFRTLAMSTMQGRRYLRLSKAHWSHPE